MSFETFPKTATFKRKAYSAEIKLIVVGGKVCKPEYVEINAQLNKTFFEHYTRSPYCVYIVHETNLKPHICRGFIFETQLGWGFIVRNSPAGGYSDFPFESPNRCPWEEQRSRAVQKVITQSRAAWEISEEKENRGGARSRSVATHNPSLPENYRILGVKPGCTTAELKSAYRLLCRKHHPDTGDGDRVMLEKVIDAYKKIKKLKEFSQNCV